MTTVLIADDQEIVLNGLRMILESVPDVEVISVDRYGFCLQA